jgi:hypothetical protein
MMKRQFSGPIMQVNMQRNSMAENDMRRAMAE